MYAEKLRSALKGAVDTRKLAEAWAAMHPRGAVKAIPPALSAFLARARHAIEDAYRKVIPDALAEGYVLGQQSAKALARPAAVKAAAGIEAELEAVDWAGWEPGDVEAAFQVAGGGLRDLLASQEVQIKSITGSRLEELGNILAEYLSSAETVRPELPEPVPPMYSVDALATALAGVLDNPDMAYMVAQTEIARAASIASQEVYRSMGIGDVEVSTAADTRVCAKCAAAEAAGPRPLGTYSVPLHPMCRCALIPVLAGAS